MADAVTSVGAIRAGDTITYIDHFGGDSEGPVSTAILLLHTGTQTDRQIVLIWDTNPHTPRL